MAKRITLDFLSEQSACSKQRALFAKQFPLGTEVTRQLCEEYAKQFDFNWAAEYLLPKEAWQEYLRTRDEALAEYQRIRNEAAWTEYERIDDEALAEYERIDFGAWAEYRRLCATEFARLWLEYMPD